MDEHFDEYFGTYLEDYDFFMRCKLAGLKAKYAEDALAIHADKKSIDYSERYYLEIRNMIYGKIKLGKLAAKSGLYNPFTFASIFKAFIFGFMNFAWFNWNGYDRKNKSIANLFSPNKIFQKFKFVPLIFIKAVVKTLADKKYIREKASNVRKFYN